MNELLSEKDRIGQDNAELNNKISTCNKKLNGIYKKSVTELKKELQEREICSYSVQ